MIVGVVTSCIYAAEKYKFQTWTCVKKVYVEFGMASTYYRVLQLPCVPVTCTLH